MYALCSEPCSARSTRAAVRGCAPLPGCAASPTAHCRWRRVVRWPTWARAALVMAAGGLGAAEPVCDARFDSGCWLLGGAGASTLHSAPSHPPPLLLLLAAAAAAAVLAAVAAGLGALLASTTSKCLRLVRPVRAAMVAPLAPRTSLSSSRVRPCAVVKSVVSVESRAQHEDSSSTDSSFSRAVTGTSTAAPPARSTPLTSLLPPRLAPLADTR
mmetsp:Transcript_35234/g.89178  ORF Transcript_35234/g.89178 Transcript_35234/m.89178 type:complete len:214 (-) Transcript_35234:2583-3224(-)